MERRIKSLKKYISVVLLITVITIGYILNVSSKVFGGDSADITTASTTFGNAHPPGYPLLMLINNIAVRLIPFLNPYQKISVVNCLFTLISLIFVYLFIKKITRKNFIGLYGAVFFATLFPIWLYSIVPEVFSLAWLLIVIQFYCLYFILQKPQKSLFFIFLISIGLSISHHHFFVFFLPGYFWLINQKPSLKKLFFSNKLKNVSLILLGTLFYLYAPIVSFFKAPLDIENAKTLNGFIRLLTRASYGTFKAFPWSSGDITNRLFDSLSTITFIIHDFKPLGLLLILFGGYFLHKENRVLFKFLFIHTISIVFFFFYSNFSLAQSFGTGTYERFLTFLYIPLIFYFSFGILYLFKNIYSLFDKYLKNIFLKTISKLAVYLFFIIYLFINSLSNYQILKQIKNLDVFEKFGQDILNTPKKNSILILSTDNSWFITQNLFHVQNYRNDLAIMTMVYLERPHLQKELVNRHHLYFPKIDLTKIDQSSEDFLKKNYQRNIEIFSDRPKSVGLWIPYGILWKYYPDIKIFNNEVDEIIKINQRLWQSYSPPQLSKQLTNILFTRDINKFYADQSWTTINFYLTAEQNELAESFADQYYRQFKNEYNFLIAFINVKAANKSCQPQGYDSVNKLIQQGIKQAKDHIPLINYLQTCGKDQAAENLIQQYEKMKKIEAGLLESF